MYVTTNLEDLPLVKLNFEDSRIVVGIKDYVVFISINGMWFSIGINEHYKYPYNKRVSLEELTQLSGVLFDAYIQDRLSDIKNIYFDLHRTDTIGINPVQCNSVNEFITMLTINKSKRKQYKNNLKPINPDIMVGVAFKLKYWYSKFQQISLSNIYYRKPEIGAIEYYHVVNGEIECMLDKIDDYMFIESDIHIGTDDVNKIKRELEEVGDKILKLPTVSIHLTPINNGNNLVKNINLYIVSDNASNVKHLLHKINHKLHADVYETLTVTKTDIKLEYTDVYNTMTGKKERKPLIWTLSREDKSFFNVMSIGNTKDISIYLDMVIKD